jgi:hypothetical protein
MVVTGVVTMAGWKPVRHEHHGVGVVVGEATVFGEFLRAAGVGDADVWGHQDIRGAGIAQGR